MGLVLSFSVWFPLWCSSKEFPRTRSPKSFRVMAPKRRSSRRKASAKKGGKRKAKRSAKRSAKRRASKKSSRRRRKSKKVAEEA